PPLPPPPQQASAQQSTAQKEPAFPSQPAAPTSSAPPPPLHPTSTMSSTSGEAPNRSTSTNTLNRPKRSASDHLREFCRANGKNPPQFFEEKSTDGAVRIWVIVDNLKYELPHPKEGDGHERLALRVLKHVQRETEKEKEKVQSKDSQ
ncbi:hypothetical protein P7C70_g8201, partial [Phenoliferia sp. Uapishka_3]